MKRKSEAPTIADLVVASPAAHAFNLLGDRWTWLILRDLFLGFRRFEDLRRRTGAARGTLTSRLNVLVDNGILYRNPYQSGPIRYEYRLTDNGFGLYPLALSVWAWEHKWAAEHEDLPKTLFHRGCGKVTTPQLRCNACRELIYPADVTYSAGSSVRKAERHDSGGQRRRRLKSVHPEGVDKTFFHAVDIIGDRWTGIVIGSLWFGLHRYADIASATGIATNILADRLKRLTADGVLERKAYRENPARYEYRFTEKGRDLYGIVLTLHQWADRWLVGSNGSGLTLQHNCGKPLVGVMTCSTCNDCLELGEVSYGDRDGN